MSYRMNSDNCRQVGTREDFCERCGKEQKFDIYYSEGRYWAVCSECDYEYKEDSQDEEFTL